MDVLTVENQSPLVSVCMTAYNQAAYIVDAIEGVLMQQTSFRFELLIGEDCSTKDDTLRICREYEQKYSDIIKVIHDEKNYGMVANEQRLMDAAKGKYIAFCEADDYWIDPLKLKKQVDVLEQNPQYSACACQSKIIFGSDKENYQLLYSETQDTVYTLQDLILKYPFQTASFIFRAQNVKNIPNLPVQINGWDRAVFFINAYRGDIYWIKDALAVYRKNVGGISQSVSFMQMKGDLAIYIWFKKIASADFPLNALRVHILIGIISTCRKINTINLLIYYFQILYYLRKVEFGKQIFFDVTKGVMLYRLPKFIRRIFRKIYIVQC